MKIIKTEDYKEMSEKASEILVDEIDKKPDLIIGFATGKTPLGLYKELIKEYKKGKVSFSRIKAFNLDEYYPVKKNNKKSFYNYLFKNFFNKINIRKTNIRLLDGETKNPKKECSKYEKLIKKNPIDIQILGVGIDGHIAFNQPGSSKKSRTRLINFSKGFSKSNGFKKALTVGIQTILSAKKIILLASGEKKAEAIKRLVRCDENKNWPVSFLRGYKNLILIIDKKAGKFL